MKSKILNINKQLNNREISATELAKSYLNKISDSKLNAFITVCEETALKNAGNIDKKISSGEQISPLAGIPMALKDNIVTKGIRTTAASKMLENHLPVYSATTAKLLQDQGATLLGKTNMDEFGMGATSETSYFGVTLNPKNHARVAGGSSSGSATATADDLAVFTLGTDTGGSVRGPASFCGCVGLKPTYGALSRFGVVSCASSLDCVGLLTQSVDDAKIVFDALNKYDSFDSTSTPTDMRTGNLKNNKKIAVVKEFFEDVPNEISSLIFKTLDVYKAEGYEVVEYSVSALQYALQTYLVLSCAEAATSLGKFDGIRFGHRAENFEDMIDMTIKSRTEGFGEEVKRRVLFGNFVLSQGNYETYYKKAQDVRAFLTHEFSNIFTDCDAIFAPTSAFGAPKLGAKTPLVDSYKNDALLAPANLCKIPALTVNVGADTNGLPVGLQILGDKFCEDKIFEIAKIAEVQSNV